MNRTEAKLFLEAGGTLTHSSFTRSEWVKGCGNGMYVFEDGCICDADEFWRIRSDACFDSGWTIKSRLVGRMVNVGTIGHVDSCKSTLTAAINSALVERNKSDRKRSRSRRWQ